MHNVKYNLGCRGIDLSRIALIEDDPEILEMLRFNLEAEGYSLVYSQNGHAGLAMVLQDHPDLILLDLLLPGIDGLEICRQLKGNRETQTIPIIIVSAKGHESDIVLGLGLGADDYITKPFSVRELIARVKAALRRRQYDSNVTRPLRIAFEGLVIDHEMHKVLVNGEEVFLRPAEFAMLYALASVPGRVWTKDQLLNLTNDDPDAVISHNVEVRISEIRKKLGPYRETVETVWGVGYRFREKGT